jgi:hypothetical protein
LVSVDAVAPDVAATKEGLMSDDKPSPKALADNPSAGSPALGNADPVVMRHDLEMILTVLDNALHPRGPE